MSNKLIVLTLLIPSVSYAYLDPGTGSFILQAIVAGAMGAIFTIKLYWKKIRSYFTKNKN